MASREQCERSLLEKLHAARDGIGDIEECGFEYHDGLRDIQLAALVIERPVVGRREKVVRVSHEARIRDFSDVKPKASALRAFGLHSIASIRSFYRASHRF